MLDKETKGGGYVMTKLPSLITPATSTTQDFAFKIIEKKFGPHNF